jgi:hypothetical protein
VQSVQSSEAIAQRRPVAAFSAAASLSTRIQDSEFLWFGLAAIGIIVLEPRFWLLARYLGGYMLQHPEPRPVLAGLPHLSPIVPIALAAFLLTFFSATEVRLKLLALMVLPFAVLDGGLDAPSALPIAAVVGTTYLLLQLPLSPLRLSFVVAGFCLVCTVLMARLLPGDAVDVFLGGWPVLMPMLWYSAHRQARGRLSLREFASYISCRLVTCPAITYDDLRTASDDRLRATRWAGMRALYIALAASFAQSVGSRFLTRFPLASVHGFTLLATSYVHYVSYYCGIVLRFNVFIGIVRLFGIGVRSNFNYWLLARTPNEHWQRWNILTREWIITFVFFPIMRRHRQLFLAVFGALLTSGILHMAPDILTGESSVSNVVAGLIYWFANAAAIYAVLALPTRFPERLAGLGDSRLWSVVGIVLTSCFYAVLHGLVESSDTWSSMASFCARLLT